MLDLMEAARAWGGAPEVMASAPAADAVNPADRRRERRSWPVDPGDDELTRRRGAAARVAAAAAAGWRRSAAAADDLLMLDEQAEVQQWDAEIERLLVEARASRADEVAVPMPATLSATAMLRMNSDPDGLARDLARPMPRRPSPTARFGTRFHAWVESHLGQQQLLDPDELPGRADLDISGDADLRTLVEAFKGGPFGDRSCHQVEAPFTLVLGGHVVRGRIDAVYATDDGYLVVDWKTNREQTADPLQLAIYRVAWAELTGVPVERVRAGFFYVRSGDLVTFDDLPDRSALEEVFRAGG
jgi:DNA helicase-2/ATP-dependent DNA helicase PcrA